MNSNDSIEGGIIEKDEAGYNCRRDWALSLMDRGVIVSLSISRWDALITLTPEVLGFKSTDMDDSDLSKKYLKLCSQKLLPIDVLRVLMALDKKARRLLARLSFNTIWGHFIPFTAFETWDIANEEIRMQYIEIAKKIGNNYGDLIMQVKDTYKDLSIDVWARLYPNNTSGITSSFIESFSSNIIDQIPPVETVVSSFSYRTTYSTIPILPFIGIGSAYLTTGDTNELELQVKKKIVDRQTVQESVLIDDFLEKTVTKLRKDVVQTCNGVLGALERRVIAIGRIEVDLLHGQKVILENLIIKFKEFNFYRDSEIEDLLIDLAKILNTYDYKEGEGSRLPVINKVEQIIKIASNPFLFKHS